MVDDAMACLLGVDLTTASTCQPAQSCHILYKCLKVSIRAKTLMQRLNNGSILFIFVKKLL